MVFSSKVIVFQIYPKDKHVSNAFRVKKPHYYLLDNLTRDYQYVQTKLCLKLKLGAVIADKHCECVRPVLHYHWRYTLNEIPSISMLWGNPVVLSSWE